MKDQPAEIPQIPELNKKFLTGPFLPELQAYETKTEPEAKKSGCSGCLLNFLGSLIAAGL
ncbi:MAG: hypothetical protein LBP22_05025 [Deltaproteobacteria bacterium]|nr:hypothetical protein [Deltaproteobacteria bacterium]